MLPIKIFIHCYATEHGLRIVKEQQKLLESVGLINGIESEWCVCYEHETDKEKRYEGRTLEWLYHCSCNFRDPFLALYIHTKGASRPMEQQASMADFRTAIGSVVIHEWQECVKHLSLRRIDCYGSFFPTDDRFFFPGNFWWARSDHIRSLPLPSEYAAKSGRTGENIRYAYEDWITLGREGVVAAAKYKWQPEGKEGAKAEEWGDNCYHTFKKGNHVVEYL